MYISRRNDKQIVVYSYNETHFTGKGNKLLMNPKTYGEQKKPTPP
jgi:hypothetical protein